MNYKLVCKKCKAVCWAPGEDDPDTGTFEIDEDRVDWSDAEDTTCKHEEYDVVDAEYPQPLDDDVY